MEVGGMSNELSELQKPPSESAPTAIDVSKSRPGPGNSRVREAICKKNFECFRWCLMFSIVGTFTLVVLSGFHPFGFILSDSILTFLITATVGELAGLFIAHKNFS